MAADRRAQRRKYRRKKASKAKPAGRLYKTKYRPTESAPARPGPLIVGVGASAGGLEAFTRLLQSLPNETGMAFVLVQHLDPARESALSDLLSRITSLPVREVTDDLPVEPDHVYVIPPNHSLGVTDATLRLRSRKPIPGAHRVIDQFFESLAQDQGERAIGVVLSGSANDGTLGLEAIKAEGGITFAQDESARYDSMPRSAVAAGCVDFILKPEDIAKELAIIAKHPYVASGPGRSERKADQGEAPEGGQSSPRIGARQIRAEANAPQDQ